MSGTLEVRAFDNQADKHKFQEATTEENLDVELCLNLNLEFELRPLILVIWMLALKLREVC